MIRVVLVQFEIQEGHWQAGLQALPAAEKAGANQQKINAWREWAQSRLAFEKQKTVNLPENNQRKILLAMLSFEH